MREEVREKTLRELVEPDMDQHPLCIVFPLTTVPFKLKRRLINLLPTFRGLARENPHKHIKDFHMVCVSLRPHGVTKGQLNLRAFPFSLQDDTKDWLYYLAPESITTWNELKKKFLEKILPAFRAHSIRKDIYGIKQFMGESLSEYWECYKYLCANVPRHQIYDQLLIQYFYNGLLTKDRNLIDSAAGGGLADKALREAQELISRMVENNQNFGTRATESNLAQGGVAQVKACGACGVVGHASEACSQAQVGVITLTLSGEVETKDKSMTVLTVPINHRRLPQLQKDSFQWSQDTKAYQQETRASMANLRTQVTELAAAINRIENKSSRKLPAQPDHANVSGVTLRSGKELPSPKTSSDDPSSICKTNKETEKNDGDSETQPPKEQRDEELIEMEVQINIALLNAIKQIPKYAKFLKELCTNKRKDDILHDENDDVNTLIALYIDIDSHDLSLAVVDATKIYEPSSDFDMFDLQVQGTELKALLSHLKYVYLGERNTLPVIISKELTLAQEESLIDILKTYKEAI
ncbi:uncharacterized protein LOC120068960 [Benincasa hispida]|uniref:uncharacterized protein LOC120068960 n=1 Tax=Benincasa hispida TaxID=102211 RepID=UPI0018FFAF35|nr:uncharacterized protein LOC120068960 [Benincasa hispida]